MDRCTITFFMILFVLVYNRIEAKQEEDDCQQVEQHMSKRCLENSVTRVSCKNFNSDDALLPHPDDCELFYYCVSPDHEPICRQCPAQLHFNPIKHVCDVPERAGCVVSVF
ncbi:unnamed protein product [Euphydryas editha]|uniref:Chitin-binding type-2 domain-containing protein n=1 Tax=Euphydryas editha TaxID=104508 RepID=A0AAU9UXW7_EUPED|nr:unnamed protein product [Euphydryas editha]